MLLATNSALAARCSSSSSSNAQALGSTDQGLSPLKAGLEVMINDTYSWRHMRVS
jgi:hypothetical protein